MTMKTAVVHDAVHRHITRLLDGNAEFDDSVSLEQLGLDKQDIEDLIFHLEDELELTAFTNEEDRLLKSAPSANDVCWFLLEVSRR